MSALLENLRRICGDANVLTHDDPQTDLSAWEQDWRKRSHGKALAVVRPINSDSNAWTTEVVDALKKHKVSIVVTTSVAPDGIACWLTTKTSELSVISLAA